MKKIIYLLILPLFFHAMPLISMDIPENARKRFRHEQDGIANAENKGNKKATANLESINQAIATGNIWELDDLLQGNPFSLSHLKLLDYVLYQAITMGKNNVIEHLTDAHHVQLDVYHPDYISPVHYAAYADQLATVKYLIEKKGMSPNFFPRAKTTPLHEAVRGSSLRTAIYLISQGAQKSTQNSQGKLPVDIAHEQGAERIMAYLQMHHLENTDEDNTKHGQ